MKENKLGLVVEYYSSIQFVYFHSFVLQSVFMLFVSISVTIKLENKISRKQGRTVVWPQSPCAIRMSYGKDIPS